MSKGLMSNILKLFIKEINNNYLLLSNGLLLQWGYNAVSCSHLSSNLLVNLHVPYANTSYLVFVTPSVNNNHLLLYMVADSNGNDKRTKSSFNIYSKIEYTGQYSRYFNWFTIGRINI